MSSVKPKSEIGREERIFMHRLCSLFYFHDCVRMYV